MFWDINLKGGKEAAVGEAQWTKQKFINILNPEKKTLSKNLQISTVKKFVSVLK